MTAVESAIKAAMGVARDVAEGTLSPAQLDAVAVGECRRLVGQVVGPGDALWGLQLDVARGVLAAGGVPAGELAEWLAVTRAAEGVTSGGNGFSGMSHRSSWIERALAEMADDDGGLPDGNQG